MSDAGGGGGYELAVAYVSVTASAKGLVTSLAAELQGLDLVAGEAGEKASKGFLDKFGGGMKKVGVVAAAVAAAVGVGLFAVGSSFDDAFDNIRIKTGATDETLSGLQDTFREVVSSVPTSFGNASEAIATLNQKLGLTGEPLKTVTSQVLEMSRITGTDLKANLASVTSAFLNFGVGAADQSGKLDLMFRASQATGISVADLSAAMASSGAVLRSVGLDFDQSTAFVAAMAKAGIDVADVMPALSRSLVAAAKDGKDAKTVFAETFDAIRNAPNDTEAAGIALDVLGARSGPKFAALIREGKISYEELLGTIQGGKETIKGAADSTADWREKFDILKNKTLVALEPIASKVFEGMGKALDWISPKVEQLTKWLQEHEGVAQTLAVIIGGALVTALAAAAVQMGILAAETVIATWPILAIVAAVAAVVGGIYWLWSNWDKVWNWIMNHKAIAAVIAILAGPITAVVALVGVIKYLWDNWNWIWPAIQNVMSTVWGYIKPIWDTLVSVIQNVIVPAAIKLWEVMQTVWSAISNAISAVWGGVIQPIFAVWQWWFTKILVPVLGMLWDIWSMVFGAIANLVTFWWNNVVQPIWTVVSWVISNVLIPNLSLLWDVFSMVFNAISTVVTTVWRVISPIFFGIKDAIGDVAIWVGDKIAAIVDFVTSIPSKIGDVGSTIANAIGDAFKGAWNSIADFVNDIIPNQIGFDWGPSLDLPDNPLPKFHSGGIVPGAPGQEILAVLQAGERIIPANGVLDSTMAGTGWTQNNYFHEVAADPNAISHQLAWNMRVAG